MPIQYDVANDILNSVRTRLNDELTTLQAIGGSVLKNTQPFSQWALNTAWRKFQLYLADQGCQLQKRELTYSGFAAVGTTDPAVLCSISTFGYYNGASNDPSKALPADFIFPLKLWERLNGSNGSMLEMDRVFHGLPRIPKTAFNRLWEMANDEIFIPGSTSPFDLQIRYMGTFPDFLDNVPVNNIPWYSQQVPIERATEAVSLFMCAEVQTARQDIDGSAAFLLEGKVQAQLIINRETMEGKSVYKYSELQKMADRYTPNQGPDTNLVKRGG